MKKSTFKEEQILKILREQDSGKKVSEIARQHGISKATFYNWKSKYGGMELHELKRLKELEEENARLKKMYSEKNLDYEILKDVLEKKF